MSMMSTSSGVAEPRISLRLLQVFAVYSRHFVRRHFGSIKILKDRLPPSDLPYPVVIYLNHASWWDPLVCLFLARKYFAERRSFAPIDAESLKHYAFFERLGFYGVVQKSVVGATTFLRTTCSLLGSKRNAVWLTPQGQFADIRQRPLRLQKGIGSLAARTQGVAFVPLAIEYTFWTGRQPEILLSFGEVIVPSETTVRTSLDWAAEFGHVLESVQDDLASKAVRRDTADWLVLDQGASGVHPIYDLWRRLRSKLESQKSMLEQSQNLEAPTR
jgi:1-acyl-sn-glycerol-3-phosphate acyltransferase